MSHTDLANYFPRKKGSPESFRAPCPVHGERDLNLAVKYHSTKGKWTLNCYSRGCTLKEIATAAGFPPSAIYDEDRDDDWQPRITATQAGGVALLIETAKAIRKQATLEDTFGPNPCKEAKFRNDETGETFATACDSKRCKDCGPRKAKLFYDGLRQIGDTGWVHTFDERAEVDRALERAKKRKQRNALPFTYCVVGDDHLGYIVWSDEQLDGRQRFMALKDWKRKLIHAWKYGDSRLRRSQGLRRLSLVVRKRTRQLGTSGWNRVFARLLSGQEIARLEQERRDMAFAEENGWVVWDEGRKLRSIVEANPPRWE